MFTIKVKKREVDEEVTFEEIQKEVEVVHADCHGGKGLWTVQTNGTWDFTCSRCGASTKIAKPHEKQLLVAKTAVDGKKREISKAYGGEGKIVVIREKAIRMTNESARGIKMASENQSQNVWKAAISTVLVGVIAIIVIAAIVVFIIPAMEKHPEIDYWFRFFGIISLSLGSLAFAVLLGTGVALLFKPIQTNIKVLLYSLGTMPLGILLLFLSKYLPQ